MPADTTTGERDDVRGGLAAETYEGRQELAPRKGSKADELLREMGLEVETLEAGCCGLAGSWGFEAGHYELSLRCGEQGLLPTVRQLDEETIVVADGFSCRTQIEHAAGGRRGLHVAQVLALAREHGPSGPPGPRPERLFARAQPQPPLALRVARATVAAACLAGGAAAVAAAARMRA